MPIIIYKHPEHSATNAIRAFNATVRALAADDEVVEFNSRELQFRFAQDQCLVLDKEKVVIFPNSPGIPDDLKNEIVSHFEAQGFEVLETETFFEGGNIVRVNDTIFHGNYPAGGYLSTGHDRDQVKKYNEVVAEMQEMARAHPKLSHLTFDELGLATQFNEGIEFAQRFPIFNGNLQLYIPEEEFDETLQSSAMKNFTAWREYFYHLDCFIALAPDNKIFILSSNILSSESIAKLRVAADNNIQLVDLGHDNFIDEPTMLNLAFFRGMQDEVRVIVPGLPNEVTSKIKEHYTFAITPEILREDLRLQEMIREYSNGDIDFTQLDGLIVNKGGPHCMSLSYSQNGNTLASHLPFFNSNDDSSSTVNLGTSSDTFRRRLG